MSVKLVALMRKAPGLTRAQFRDHYENKHAPLIRELMPAVVEYRRNYFPETVAGFDVLTEITFETRESFETAMAGAMQGRAKEMREADEALLFEVAAHAISTVEVCE